MDLHDAHQVWLDGRLIPQTPEKITYDHEDKTEVHTMVDGSSLTLGRRDGPATISFDFKDTIQEYPWTYKEAPRQDWFEFFHEKKTGQNPFQLDIKRYYTTDLSIKVILTDWSYVEDANDHSDWTFSITLMEWCPQNAQELDEDIQHHLIKNRTTHGWRAGGR